MNANSAGIVKGWVGPHCGLLLFGELDHPGLRDPHQGWCVRGLQLFGVESVRLSSSFRDAQTGRAPKNHSHRLSLSQMRLLLASERLLGWPFGHFLFFAFLG